MNDVQDGIETASGGRAFLSGGGELGERMRALDWTKTPLGPPEAWPQSLKTAVRIMLTSRQPIWIGWGDELIYLYNDAYKTIIGGKHPDALGKPTAVVWREIWKDIDPLLSTALSGDEGTYVEEQLLIMERYGYPEETYYTFSYSPIPKDTATGGRAGGIICANTDDTQRVIGERQIALLRELAANTADARTWRDACARSIEALGSNPKDISFAAIYVYDAKESRMTLAGATGFEGEHPAFPQCADVEGSIWPFEEALRTNEIQVVDDLETKAFGASLPTGGWPVPSARAALLPIAVHQEAQGLQSVVIVGLNPYRLFDDDYQGFLELAANQISASLASAIAYEQERSRAEGLAELDRAKTVFFSNVSHEFRTPLTLMMGPIEALLDEATSTMSDEERESLSLVRRNARRLQKLVNALLDFSRIEAGRMRASYEPTQLAAFTAELASNFRSACDRAGLELVVDCPPLPSPVFVDRTMWENIVLNLLSNAFKFTWKGKIEVVVREDDGRAQVVVRDTGTGIPEDALPMLFERFHRVAGAQGRTLEGSGIGLALVQELVRLHGGDVRVESTLGVGTSFIVTLPFGRDHLPADAIGDAKALPSTAARAAPFVEEALRWVPNSDDAGTVEPASPDAPQFTILLADDNADMRDYIRNLLDDQYKVVAVADGRAALAAVETHAPDLIISDIMMPGLDGFGLLAELRGDPATAELPVILLSARAGEEARIEGLHAGADDYLTKPFGARELLARVSTHLALSKMRRATAATLRESESRFRNMADNAPVIIWVSEPNGDCSYLGQQWYRFTGASPDESLGVGWLDFIHPEDRESTNDQFRTANASFVPFRFECRLRRRDDEWRWMIASATPRFGAGEEFLGYIGSLVDVSELKHVENQLREADRRKDEFLAILAHELRNPLAPIRTGLELMKMAPDDARTIERVRSTMERQTTQLITIVDDLLDVSRITRGKLELRKIRVELNDVIESAVEASRPLIDEARHELVVTKLDTPLFLDADPHRLAQVLSNLLNNSAKYTPPGGRIHLFAEAADGVVTISVTDNGVGIPADMLDSIFEMFAQVERPLEKSHTGLGIGLTLVRSLVEMHNGTIGVDSAGLNRGSRFWVRLPHLEVSAPKEDATAESAEAHGVRRRVLVVDDNEAAAEMLALVVEMMGNEVRTASDGVEALEVAAEFRPEVVLMDIGMPRMNGYEAATELRRQPWGRDVTLIALTGWGQDEDKARTRAAGFDHHLVKPAEPATVKALLAKPPRR